MADVIERLMAEFEDRHFLAGIVAVIAGARHDLRQSAVAAPPEFLERLARQRLFQECTAPGV